MEGWIRKYLVHDTVCRSFPENWGDIPIGCGFLPKTNENYYDLACDDYALVYILNGSGTFIDETGEKHPLKAGDAFHRMPGAKHSSTADRNSNYWELYLSLGPDFFRHLVELKVINTNIQFWRCGLQYEWINEVWCFKDRLKQADYLDGSQAMLIIYKLINDLRLQGERNSVLGRDGRIIRGMELLRANCCTSRSQKEIAGKVGMSHERFRKVFKEQAGITPGQYRIRCRMDKAKALLNNRALSLSEIAMELGYPDVFSFSRQFRQQAGIPPGRYRLYSDISYIL